MDPYGIFSDEQTLTFKRILKADPEEVWAYLTESDKKEQWLSAGDVDARVGGKVTHEFNHSRLSEDKESLPEKYKDIGETSIMYGEVTVWEPHSHLAYTWDEGSDGMSEVHFRLKALSTGQTELTLTHKRIPDSEDFKIGVGAGWHTHLNILEHAVEGKISPGFWSVHMPLEGEYTERLNS